VVRGIIREFIRFSLTEKKKKKPSHCTCLHDGGEKKELDITLSNDRDSGSLDTRQNKSGKRITGERLVEPSDSRIGASLISIYSYLCVSQ